jgi:cytidine deaminase
MSVPSSRGPISTPAINWAALRTEATRVAGLAYAPYSHLHVGAAGLTLEGTIVSGCNVENASFGLTLCAECGLVSALHASGGGTLVAVVCVDGAGNYLAPCGRCRQLLYEHGPELLLGWDPEPLPITDLLPHAFGPVDLPEGGAEREGRGTRPDARRPDKQSGDVAPRNEAQRNDREH